MEVVVGVKNVAMGGKFKDGFIAAAAGAGVSHLSNFTGLTGSAEAPLGIAGKGSWKQFAGRTALAAVGGGTAEKIAGGKFANGAYTAAFQHILNSEAASAIKRYSMHMTDKAKPKDAEAFKARAIGSAGWNGALPTSSGKGIIGWLSKMSGGNLLDIHAHGYSGGIVGDGNNSGLYHAGSKGGSSASLWDLARGIAGSNALAQDATIRIFACNCDRTASALAWVLGDVGRGDITVIGANGKVSPITNKTPISKRGGLAPFTGSFVDDGGLHFNSYKGRKYLGSSKTLKW